MYSSHLKSYDGSLSSRLKKSKFLASSSVKDYLILSERSFRTFTISNTARASARLPHHCR